MEGDGIAANVLGARHAATKRLTKSRNRSVELATAVLALRPGQRQTSSASTRLESGGTMTSPRTRTVSIVFALLAVASPKAHAQLSIGTWVKEASPGSPGMVMTVEECCGGGRRLIYRLQTTNKEVM